MVDFIASDAIIAIIVNFVSLYNLNTLVTGGNIKTFTSLHSN